MAKKKIDELPLLGRTPAAGDLVAGWDGALNKTVAIDASTFATSGGGGGGGTPVTTVPSPFIVQNTDSGYHYDAETGNTTIKDVRLLKKQLYPVSTDQMGGGDFHLSQLTYNIVDPDDDSVGSVVISGFQLDDEAHITIIVPGAYDPAADITIAEMRADISLLKLICGPFIPTALGANEAKIWWIGPIANIPPGYQICHDMDGYYPIAIDSANPDLDYSPKHPVGDDDITITAENLPKVIIDLPTNDGLITPGGAGKYVGVNQTSAITAHVQFGSDNPESIKNRPKSLTGVWIEFVGI